MLSKWCLDPVLDPLLYTGMTVREENKAENVEP